MGCAIRNPFIATYRDVADSLALYANPSILDYFDSSSMDSSLDRVDLTGRMEGEKYYREC